MPTGNLPESGKKLWEMVYEESKNGVCVDADDPEACAAKLAWSAVKNAGWIQDDAGEWTKKSDLQEFSLRIERASYDKASGEMRWRMVASDVDADSYNDSMSLELFQDFINRAMAGTNVPMEFRSNFWSGGMPYLSISHYTDLEGDAVPGKVDGIYIDGSYFKAKGTYFDTDLGRACFRSVCRDMYDKDRIDADDRVRVSIAFLDYAHQHKSNGYVFERSDDSDICPECFAETIMAVTEGKAPQGRTFLKGHLIHLAHTRSPANSRTSMEVDKSMTTRKEDAASIVGEELAEEFEKKSKLIGKSDALIIKSDTESVDATDEVVEPAQELVVENVPVIPSPEAQIDMKELVREAVREALDMNAKSVVTPEVHPLDSVFAEFKSVYDGVASGSQSYEERMTHLQPAFESLAISIRELASPKSADAPVASPTQDFVMALSEVMRPLSQKLDLIATQLSNAPKQSSAALPVPARRSIQLDIAKSQYPRSASETPKLRALIERNT